MHSVKPFMALAWALFVTAGVQAAEPGNKSARPTEATTETPTGTAASNLYGTRPTDHELSFIRAMAKRERPLHAEGSPPTVIGAPPMKEDNSDKTTLSPRQKKPFVVDIHAADVGSTPSDLSLLQQLQICRNDTCQPVTLSAPREPLKSNTLGEATRIGTATLPARPDIEETSIIEINRITLRSDSRGHQAETQTQSLNLARPIRLFSILPGARIFIGLDAQAVCPDSPCLKLHSADTTLTPLHDEAQYLYYNPATGMDRTWPLGIRLQLPRQMTDGVQIVVTSVRASPTRAYPDMDFSIHAPMKRKATVRMSPRGAGHPPNAPGTSAGPNTNAMPDARKERIIEMTSPGRIVDGMFLPRKGPSRPPVQ